MPKYRIGGAVVRRKNLYMPCAIAEDFDGMPPERQAEVLRKTWWADNITAAEWPVVLSERCSPSAKSRLKKKMVGWFMAQSRIAALAPGLYNEALDAASALYIELIGEPSPMFNAPKEETKNA